MAQGGEPELGQVFQHKHAVDGGRATEGGYRVFIQQLQGAQGDETLGVVHEQRRALVPGAEIAAPGGLGPARVGAIPVQVLGPEVQPVLAGGLVRQPIAVGVQAHLGITRRTGGEIAHGDIAGRGVHRLEVRGLRGDGAAVIQPAIALAIHQHPHFQPGALGERLVDLVGVGGIGHHAGGPGRIDPVGNVARRELGGARADDRPHAQGRGEHFPPGYLAPQYHDDVIAGFHPGVPQQPGYPARGGGDIGKAAPFLPAVIIHPQQRQFIRIALSPVVHHIASEVEPLGTWPAEVAIAVFVIMFSHRSLLAPAGGGDYPPKLYCSDTPHHRGLP